MAAWNWVHIVFIVVGRVPPSDTTKFGVGVVVMAHHLGAQSRERSRLLGLSLHSISGVHCDMVSGSEKENKVIVAARRQCLTMAPVPANREGLRTWLARQW